MNNIQNNEVLYSFKIGKRVGMVRKDMIMYINCRGRVITIRTVNSEVDYNGTLKDAIKRLGDGGFVRINKSDMINVRYVMSTDFKVVRMEDGCVLPISSLHLAEFCQSLTKCRKIL